MLFLGVPKAIAAQCLGGLFFSVFGGQPLIVVSTTAPLTIYVKGKYICIFRKSILYHIK